MLPMPAILLLLLMLWNTTAGALTLTDEEKPGSLPIRS